MTEDQQLEVGTVVKISEVCNDQVRDVLKLQVGMEGVVWWHNDVFQVDKDAGPDPEQKGSEGQDLFYFQMPGSKIRVGPIGKMPDDHKVVAWVVGGKLWQVTGLRPLFNGFLRWSVVRTGEVPSFRG